ncbi:MAG: hypothetical protein KDB79_13430 [Acidobacteria bacterium]|nr:hypothetical protein [Acidobacteriota bacterium]
MKRVNCIGILLIIASAAAQLNAQSHPFPPAPIFSQLLSNVQLRDNGEFRPLRTYAYFMKGDKGTLKVLKDGSEIAEFKFGIEPSILPKYTLDYFELISGKNDVLGLILKESGKYELAYYANGEKFHSFPFELEISTGGDPYKPKKQMKLNGPWNNYAYLYKTSRESHGKWEFRIFVRSEDGEYQQSKGQVIVTRDKDKKIVAVGSSGFRNEARWRRQELVLEKPGIKNPKGEYYNNTDLLANTDKFEDGSYTAAFNIDGKPYGTYKFSVRSGEIQPQGNQIRESTDPSLFIEGGGMEFFMIKTQ